MAAHRYWRLELYGLSSWVAVSEIEFRGVVGGPDLTDAGSGAAFGQSHDGVPSYAFDNNAGNWVGIVASGANQPVYLGWAFNSPVEVNEISVVTRDWGGNPAYRIRLAYLAYSDDGSNYQTMLPAITAFNAAPATHVISGFSELPLLVLAAASTAVRLNTSWPSGPLVARASDSTGLRYDPLDGGPLSIAGTVKIADNPDIPVARRVRLFDQTTARLVRETWSAADGTYRFDKLRDGKFFLIAHDHTVNDNAAVKDQISPEVPA